LTAHIGEYIPTKTRKWSIRRRTVSRPERHDADYFPFYVKDGKTLFVLQHKYGLEGIGFFTNLMRFLTQTPDHYLCIADPGDSLYLFSRIGVDEEKGLRMIEDMVLTAKLHKSLWITHNVIVSEDLLDSLNALYEKRNNPIITIEEIEKRVSGADNPQATEFPGVETPQEGGEEEVSGDDNPQSKVKKSKVKKSREENSSAPARYEAPQIDPLFRAIRDAFLSRNIVFTDPQREIKAVRDICRLARARSPDRPDQYAQNVVEMYYWLTENGNGRFWGKQPFTPARLLSVFDDVEKQLGSKQKEADEENVPWT
jgi:hypothetical protein